MSGRCSVGKSIHSGQTMKLRTGLQHKQVGKKRENGGEKTRKSLKIYPSPTSSTMNVLTALESGVDKANRGIISVISKPLLVDGVESPEKSKEGAVDAAKSHHKVILLPPNPECRKTVGHAGTDPLLMSSVASRISSDAQRNSSQKLKASAVLRDSKTSQTRETIRTSSHYQNGKCKDKTSLDNDSTLDASVKAVNSVAHGGKDSELSKHKRCKYPWCATNDSGNASPSVAPLKKYSIPKTKAKINDARWKKDIASTSQKENLAGPSHKPDQATSSGFDALQRNKKRFSDKIVEASKLRNRHSFKVSRCKSFAKKTKDGTDSPRFLESGDTSEQMSNKKERNGQLRRLRRTVIVPSKEREAETVRLRKQLIEARKQAAEWMIDNAIENAIQRLGHNGEIKVKVLVEAFENIISNNACDTKSHRAP